MNYPLESFRLYLYGKDVHRPFRQTLTYNIKLFDFLSVKGGYSEEPG